MREVSSKDERALKKAREAEERRKLREIRDIEENIEKSEERLREIEEEMQLPENLSDFGKLAELSKEMDSLKAEIADLYDKWECLELC